MTSVQDQLPVTVLTHDEEHEDADPERAQHGPGALGDAGAAAPHGELLLCQLDRRGAQAGLLERPAVAHRLVQRGQLRRRQAVVRDPGALLVACAAGPLVVSRPHRPAAQPPRPERNAHPDQHKGDPGGGHDRE
jgi:hypothetical protein